MAGRRRLQQLGAHALLSALLLLTLVPFALMLIRSFKTFAQAMATGLLPALPIHYGGYLRA